MSRLIRVFSKFYLLLIGVIPKPVAKLLRSFLFTLKHNIRSSTNSSMELLAPLAQTKDAVLLIGHSNYLHSTGGTERIIISEVEELFKTRTDNIFVYPKATSNSVHFLKPKLYGVILNGYEICEVKSNELISFVLKLNLSEVRIHHLLQWPLKDFITLATYLKSSKINVILYIHDFLFTCPKVNRFCLSGNTLCQITLYQWTIHLWRRLFENILDLADEIKVPSEFMKGHLDSEKARKIKIFTPYTDVPTNLIGKRKIAYLGYASPIKGYDTWLKLAHNALITRAYDLVHLGNRPQPVASVPSIPYSFHSSRNCVASDLLSQNSVDFVLLWSQVPESFSFTFHEAQNAQKFVLTSRKSGNIAFEINRGKGLGLVLENEYELFQFLLKNTLERPN